MRKNKLLKLISVVFECVSKNIFLHKYKSAHLIFGLSCLFNAFVAEILATNMSVKHFSHHQLA